MNRFWTLLLCVLVFLAAFPANAASVPAIDIDPGTDVGDPPGPGQFLGSELGNVSSVIGWEFHVEELVTITHLAWYDQTGDGLSHAHRIGIWRDSDNELLVEATLPDGIGGDLIGPWRTVPITPIKISVGEYVLAGMDDQESTDSIVFVNSSLPPLLPVAAGISPFTTAVERVGYDFGPPNTGLLIPSLHLGPMFFIKPVPEPSTVALFAIGAALLVPVAQWRRPGFPNSIWFSIRHTR